MSKLSLIDLKLYIKKLVKRYEGIKNSGINSQGNSKITGLT